MVWSEFSFILQPSSLGGIGVFAATDIPDGTEIFSRSFNFRTLKIKDVPEIFRKYCIYTSDEECIAPERFDRMEIGWYINHSSQPNIEKKIEEDFSIDLLKKAKIYTTCNIKGGDEILIDYNYLNEPENMKEGYYSNSQTPLELESDK